MGRGSQQDDIEDVVVGSGTSFYWAMRLLSPLRRRGMFAVYAFCRKVDDVADDEGLVEDKLAALGEWRCEVGRIFDGQSTDALGRALVAAVGTFGLRQADFLAVIDGMEMDAREQLRAPSLAELDLYCDRVASAVGRLSGRIFGLGEEEGDRLAHELGRALQLTNILRDIAEDAERGRLYLPRELLERHGVACDPLGALVHPELPRVCAEVAEMAERHFVAAEAVLRLCNRRSRRPAAMMKGVYHALLRRLVADEWRHPATLVKLSKFEKIWIALRHAVY